MSENKDYILEDYNFHSNKDKKNLHISKAELSQTKNRRNKIDNILFILFYSIFILISIISQIKCHKSIFYFNDSYITLKVNKTGVISILSSSFKVQAPNEIIINNNTMNLNENYYDFKYLDNEIILKWDSDLITTEEMFYNCYDIT